MAQNTIYYGFSLPPATGGDFVALDHIRALRNMGFDAQAYYGAFDDGYAKFPVPVARPRVFQPDDILVIGEVHSFAAARPIPAIKVMHNQNPYMTFHGIESVAALNAYPLTHILVPSDFTAAKLKEMGVKKTISRVRPALPGFFGPAPVKKLQIAYSPNKRALEAQFLPGYFAAIAPEYASVPWVKLQGLTREECAAALASSAIYAALPLLEGLGLMNLEAMACGCHVVGYTAEGGAEYATPENGDWIAEGDHADFAERLREACRLFESKSDNATIRAARATAEKFAHANFEAELAAAWKNILGDKAGLYRL